jgi:hypothetical protein
MKYVMRNLHFIQLAPKLFGKHVNVYTFTKSLAENLALKVAKDLPFAIVRPSIGKDLNLQKINIIINYLLI